MSLYRQLIMLIGVLSLATLAGTLWINFDSTRSFLEEQLSSHAQDTATALGLTLSSSGGVDSPASVAAVDAVFDRGYYRRIVVSDAAGKASIERELPLSIEGVPAWFVRSVELSTPTTSAIVMQGWRQAGQVSVSSHPGYAYRKLWQEARQTAYWFIGLAALLLLGGSLMLHRLLAPLRLIERQARALVRREYVLQETVPRPRELRSVVEAMNALIRQIRITFESQASVVEELRTAAYRDALTGLGNRRYFERQMSARLSAREEAHEGVLVLVEVDDLQGVNARQSYEAGDALVRRVSAQLEHAANSVAHGLACRLGGATFALVLPATASGRAEHVLQEIGAGLEAQSGTGEVNGTVHMGATTYGNGEALGELLSRADEALRGVGSEDACRWRLLPAPAAAARPRLEWEQQIDEALRAGSVRLLGQPVLQLPEAEVPLHLEVLVRLQLPGNDELITAGAFMHVAEALHHALRVDRLVLGAVLKKLVADKDGASRYAVNFSPAALQDSAFQNWCFEQMQALTLAQRRRLCIEFSEPRVVGLMPALRAFAARLHVAEVSLGLDHYGRSFSDLAHLHALKPAYVKLDSAYSHELEHDNDARFLVHALCSAVRVLGTEVIAEAVTERSQLALLNELGIGGAQGFALAETVYIE